MIVRTCLLVFLVVSMPGASSALGQVRPGVAYQLEAAEAPGEAPVLEAMSTMSHDSDTDGALIGAAVGAAGLSIIGCYRSAYCGLAVVGGVLIGGIAGLAVGGLIDAADPFAKPADSVAYTDSTRLSPSKVRGPTSRRNDLIGAVIGAVAADLLVYGTCTTVSDGGRCPVFHWRYWPAIGIGALLGAGIGSAIEDTDQHDRSP